jgi:predicted RNase H-like nuclease (RuvC/YqgF family)
MQAEASMLVCDDGEFHEEGAESYTQLSVRDVKSKVSDFTRFVDGIAAENEANKKVLASTQRRLQDLITKNAAGVEEIKEHERSTERLHRIIADQESSIQDLRTDNNDLQQRVDNFANESDELARIRLTIDGLKSQLKDYITLESSGSPLITTTGQVINLV